MVQTRHDACAGLDNDMSHICLVACGSSKLGQPAPARELYVSPLFKKSRWLAERFYDKWYVLSAKHGLLAPDKVVEPYDMTLNNMPAAERRNWAERARGQLAQATSCADEITFLGGLRYRKDIMDALRDRGNKVNAPTAGMSIGKRLSWLKRIEQNPSKLGDIGRFYKLLAQLRDAQDGGRILGECNGHMEWPERGVYFLSEPEEMRRFDNDCQRVVRVGTHMVSRGAKATLWHRLSTHRGTTDGRGNHRGSILRLHIGTALISPGCDTSAAETWSKGQSASRDVRVEEMALEEKVSAFIASMRVCWLAVNDEAAPWSDRAYVERNAIGLLAGRDGPLEPPSSNWLGSHASNEDIGRSGLWNVTDVDYDYDLR